LKQRLDQYLAAKGMVASRSQAESFIRLGQVKVNGVIVKKPGTLVAETDTILSEISDQFVSRAALKLKSAAETFGLDFAGKVVLDVGSSTGGFTQYALQQGAKKVIAVDVGTDQLHPGLRDDPRIELHEKTDIRDFKTGQKIDLAVADVSFISLRELLPHVSALITPGAELVMMVKPQFEAIHHPELRHKGVIKNERMRRDILKDFEAWAMQRFKIVQKADSTIPGSKGNVERFYLLKKFADSR
jgi:23S rRNA (cytidine1920-2'-O)/16S rRNA (cytidine1409-2'-O)-methyltransferase